MKFLPITFFIAAILVAGNKAGSPSEPNLCDVVAEISYEFTSFTSNLLRIYILNLPRSEEISAQDKSGKLDGLVDVIERNADVPPEDKDNILNLVSTDDGFGGRSIADQLTRANIWDCLVSIFTGSLSQVLAG